MPASARSLRVVAFVAVALLVGHIADISRRSPAFLRMRSWFLCCQRPANQSVQAKQLRALPCSASIRSRYFPALCSFSGWRPAACLTSTLGRIRRVQVFANGFWFRGTFEHRHCARLHPHQIRTPACRLAASAFPFAAVLHSCTSPFHGHRLYSQRGTRTNHPVLGILA